MKEFEIGKNDAGQRLDRWLSKNLPLLPAPLAQKYIRLKRVKVNGKRAERDTRLQVGDRLQLYINDEFFEKPAPENAFLQLFKPRLDILYEDGQIMVLNKPAGMVVHGDETEKVNTLINHVQAYLYQKKEWSPYQEGAFTPALCNRIDRNTGGIVIAAKTAEALRVMNQKIRDRELSKRYLCVTAGRLQPPSGILRSYLRKDEEKKQVYVSHRPVPGGRTAVTEYRTLATKGSLSLVECELVTGRTHQIRAQLADAGAPLLGDGKYGSEKVNRRYGRKHQALWSWSLTFRFTTDAGEMNYLNGMHWQVPRVDFVEEYFPAFSLAQVPEEFSTTETTRKAVRE
ncbi:MAG: RluA family pseudouridine synthase [Clostridiales bacterium]|nr:RluA family pseudouridine synthase [Clostridiales bacterium]